MEFETNFILKVNGSISTINQFEKNKVAFIKLKHQFTSLLTVFFIKNVCGITYFFFSKNYLFKIKFFGNNYVLTTKYHT